MELKFNNGISFISDIIEILEEHLVSYNLKEEERTLISQQPTIP
jgi:hypothetical protein